jgi:bifunctional DNase/RNase
MCCASYAAFSCLQQRVCKKFAPPQKLRRRVGFLSFPGAVIPSGRMSKSVVEVFIRAVLSTSAGRAVFIGNDEKVFVIYVDESVGAAIAMFVNETPKERPLTHDLMGHLMTALGAKVERVIVNDLKSSTYFARLIISAENEIQRKKIIELDARPSDSIALAVQQKAPIYVSHEVWEEVEDMSDILKKMSEGGGEESEGGV